MLYDGIKLAEGSDAKNLVVETGTSFPTGPNRTPDAGELFYRTDAGNVGLWVFDGFIWQRLGTGSGELPDIVPAGIYRSVTVNTKGLVTAGTNPTTLAGYGITDAAPLGHVGAAGGAHAAATTSTAGFMSPADKTKLDSLSPGLGGGNINYTPVASGASTLVAGSRILATIVNNDPAWASTVAVLPFRTGFTEDKSSIAFTPSADAVINSTNTLFGRNTLFFDGVAPDASPGTTNFVQAASGDFPTALRLTGQSTFSIDCWLYNTGTDIRFVAGNLNDLAGTGHWWLMLNTTSGGAATVSLATTGAAYRFGTAAFPQNEWRYVRISAAGGQIACFTATTPGGAETQLGTTLAYTNAVAGTTTAPFRIGRASSWSSGTGYPFSGSIANFRVTIGNSRGGLVAGTAPTADFIGDIADFSLPTTIAAGDVFAVRNAAANAGTTFARLVIDSNRRVRPFAQGESILAAPGEEITVVASSNTELEVIAPQFDPRDIPQTIRNQNFTFGMGDRGETCMKTDTGAYAWTIAADATVNFPNGATILLVNDASSGNVTITPAGGVTLLDGAVLGSFILLPNTTRSIVKVGANRWRIS